MSPARNIRPVHPTGVDITPPLFPQETQRIADVVKAYDPWQLESLLDVNPQRALELYADFQRFDINNNGTPALLSYYGAAFQNMQLDDFTAEDLTFAQSSLRILSALYGMLRPLDGVLPHRLGIKPDFLVDEKDLYSFWDQRLYHALFQSGELVVNLASVDYAKFITPYLQTHDALLTCRFQVQKPNSPARGTVSTIRAARGMMARYIIKNRITTSEGMKSFDASGYRFIDALSTKMEYVFIKANQ